MLPWPDAELINGHGPPTYQPPCKPPCNETGGIESLCYEQTKRQSNCPAAGKKESDLHTKQTTSDVCRRRPALPLATIGLSRVRNSLAQAPACRLACCGPGPRTAEATLTKLTLEQSRFNCTAGSNVRGSAPAPQQVCHRLLMLVRYKLPPGSTCLQPIVRMPLQQHAAPAACRSSSMLLTPCPPCSQ